jgi:hypothetical protein
MLPFELPLRILNSHQVRHIQLLLCCVAPAHYAERLCLFGVCVTAEKKEIDFRSSLMAWFLVLEQSKQNHDFDPGLLRGWDVRLPCRVRPVYP